MPYVKTVVPLLASICDADRQVDASDAEETFVELRENALKVYRMQAITIPNIKIQIHFPFYCHHHLCNHFYCHQTFESLIKMDGDEMNVHMNSIVHIASRLLLVDPHWISDDSAMSDEDNEDWGDGDGDDWGLEPDSQGDDDTGDTS